VTSYRIARVSSIETFGLAERSPRNVNEHYVVGVSSERVAKLILLLIPSDVHSRESIVSRIKKGARNPSNFFALSAGTWESWETEGISKYFSS
jgi:hypothetical protein